MRRKLFTILLSSTLFTTTLTMSPLFVSCSEQAGKRVDGTDWEGVNLGSFAENDYVIDGIKGTITYISGISIHAYNLVIPNYVDHNGQKLKVYLGEKCFMNNSGISGTIELNDFIREIPTNCFSFCSSLTGVIFKNSPTNIADFAFCDTPLLSKIYVLKDGQLSTDWTSYIRHIGSFAFYRCRNLSSDLVFGSELTYIGEFAFCECSLIETVNMQFSGALSYISNGTFASSGVRKLFLSPATTMIGDEAFKLCEHLEFIKIPIKGMSLSFGKNAFFQCSELKTWSDSFRIISMGEGCFSFDAKMDLQLWEPKFNLKTIPANCFSSCGFTSLKFSPDGVQDVRDYAFADNFNLNYIDFSEYKVDDELPQWKGRHIFENCSYEGGVVVLDSQNAISKDWRNFLEDNGISISSGKWKIITAPMPITSILEPDNKTYTCEGGVATIGPFLYECIDEEFDEKYLTAHFTPYWVEIVEDKRVKHFIPSTRKLIINRIMHTITVEVTLISPLPEPGIYEDAMEFFYKQKSIESPKSVFYINVA